MEPWEFEENKWKILRYVFGLLVGATILFVLLRFVAGCDRGKPQDPFSVLCSRLISEAQEEKSK